MLFQVYSKGVSGMFNVCFINVSKLFVCMKSSHLPENIEGLQQPVADLIYSVSTKMAIRGTICAIS